MGEGSRLFGFPCLVRTLRYDWSQESSPYIPRGVDCFDILQETSIELCILSVLVTIILDFPCTLSISCCLSFMDFAFLDRILVECSELRPLPSNIVAWITRLALLYFVPEEEKDDEDVISSYDGKMKLSVATTSIFRLMKRIVIRKKVLSVLAKLEGLNEVLSPTIVETLYKEVHLMFETTLRLDDLLVDSASRRTYLSVIIPLTRKLIFGTSPCLRFVRRWIVFFE
ncbi:hypothetical protein Tco_0889904 [Tanacetum coccineum]